jgi:hypothetical protein
MDLLEFVARWSESAAAERANKDAFLIDLCDVLGVPRPDPAKGDPEQDLYVFERDSLIAHEGEKVTIGKIDLYKDGCFILEAKQGSGPDAKKLGTAKRGSPAWAVAMHDAYGQALKYARTLDSPPPFLITCDIGYCFDLYAAFDGSHDYRPFPAAVVSRIFLTDLPKHLETFQKVFTDPLSLDPARRTAKVTREVAAHLAELAKELEAADFGSEQVATFLMRCLFTMFAEDVGLLPERLFSEALKKDWLQHPEKFASGIEALWRAMNAGADFGFLGKLLRFNGGLFANPTGLPLKKPHLERLLEAAECDWAGVEPAIFGTLLERAFDPKERHALGAHFTPRAYVERLVKPTVEEPIRAEWDLVRGEVRQLVLQGPEKIPEAIKSVRAFHHWLCHIRVLDPACGSGNFLYVTLDLFKRLEGEVLSLLNELGDKAAFIDIEGVSVTPEQFRGIEIKRWAKEIADLVLWIGYLQWHFRTHGDTRPREPVLHDYKNIEWRDAVLAYDREELVTDPKTAKPVTRWDGETYKPSPVTGEPIPDESARIPLYRYVNPRRADWPEADFVLGNPPYIGNKRMRLALGDGYVEALREAHDDVPETADFVMYWWNHAASLLREGKIKRFGFITTNSIAHTHQRVITQRHLGSGVALVFAIPDHPWVDSADGAAVRVAMTVGAAGAKTGRLCQVIEEEATSEDVPRITYREQVGYINSSLTIGADVSAAVRLQSNSDLSFMGVTLVGDGFRLTADDLERLHVQANPKTSVIRPYLTGKDISQKAEPRWIIDFFGMDESTARNTSPACYQWVVDRVKPERMENKRPSYRDRWWIFGEPRQRMRAALTGLPRFLITPETSKYRFFVFAPEGLTPDHSLFAIASADALSLGILSSSVHQVWSAAAGSTLEDRPRWRNVTCFQPFPFPSCPDEQSRRIRELGEALDAHRKRQQALNPGLTITGMYNVLEKLRSGEELSAKERVIHEQGLVSVLKRLHDDLDAAVFDAYGWPHDLTDEQILEKLVALNAVRAEEEKKGLIRWLRPEFQKPAGAKASEQTGLIEGAAAEVEEVGTEKKKAAAPWPKRIPEQIAAVRDLLRSETKGLTPAQCVKSFRGTKRSEVEAALESLAALGLAIVVPSVTGDVWKASASAS